MTYWLELLLYALCNYVWESNVVPWLTSLYDLCLWCKIVWPYHCLTKLTKNMQYLVSNRFVETCWHVVTCGLTNIKNTKIGNEIILNVYGTIYID